MSVSIDDYCRNPSQYKDKLPKNTINYNDKLCDMRNDMNNYSKEILGDFGKTFSKDVKDISSKIPELMLNMIMGIFTPEGLAILSIFVGIDLVKYGLHKALLGAIARSISKEAFERCVEVSAEKSLLSITTKALTESVAREVEELAIRKAAFTLVTTLFNSIIDPVMDFVDFIMIIGMVIDAWDPCGYNQELNAENLDNISYSYNTVFAQKLSTIDIGNDEFGNPIYINKWPIEVTADIILAEEFKNIGQLDDKTKKCKSDDQMCKNRTIYINEYFENLKVNSFGNPIRWDILGEYNDKMEFDNSILLQYERDFMLMLSNNNTIVFRWLEKFWYIILTIFILFIIIFLIIK